MSVKCLNFVSCCGCLAPLGRNRETGSVYGCCLDWGGRGGSGAGLCLFSRSALVYCLSPPQRVAAGWMEDAESGPLADQLSKCTLWSLHKFPGLCLGDTLHMSQPRSLWSLRHLFLNFQYIFSSSSKSCKELAAKPKQEGSSPADKELILASPLLRAELCGGF